MNEVYIILRNNELLVDEAYSTFDKACDICEDITGFRPKGADRIYEVGPMFYIRVKSLGLA